MRAVSCVLGSSFRVYDGSPALAWWVLLALAQVRNSQLSCTLESLEDLIQDSDPLTSLSKNDFFVLGLEPQDRSCLKPPRGADMESSLGLCMLDQDRLQNLPDGL